VLSTTWCIQKLKKKTMDSFDMSPECGTDTSEESRCKKCIAVCFIWALLEFVGIPNLSFIIPKGKILHKSDLMNC